VSKRRRHVGFFLPFPLREALPVELFFFPPNRLMPMTPSSFSADGQRRIFFFLFAQIPATELPLESPHLFSFPPLPPGRPRHTAEHFLSLSLFNGTTPVFPFSHSFLRVGGGGGGGGGASLPPFWRPRRGLPDHEPRVALFQWHWTESIFFNPGVGRREVCVYSFFLSPPFLFVCQTRKRMAVTSFPFPLFFETPRGAV